MNSMHLIAEKTETTYPQKIRTYCGIEAWQERSPRDEYSTVQGDRIDATDERRRATCKRCIRAY